MSLRDELERVFDKTWAASEARQWIHGRLGRKDTDGTIKIKTGKANFVHVRLNSAGGTGHAIAYNKGVPLKAHLPVRMRLDPDKGYLIIYGTDVGGVYEEFTGGNDNVNFDVGRHTHAINSGLEYNIETLRMAPGRPQCDAGLLVKIFPFRYSYNGVWDTWENTGTIDLTSLLPASTKWCWIVVGVDPSDNSLVAVKGADQTAQTDLTDALIDAVAFPYMPCGAVQATSTDTSLANISRWKDARYWIGGQHRLNTGLAQTNVISSGTLDIDAVDKVHGLVDVRGESASDDDLVNISGGNVGDVIFLHTEAPSTYGDITVKTTGNILLADDILIGDVEKALELILTVSGWMPIVDHRLDTATVTVHQSFQTYDDIKARQTEMHIHGSFLKIADAQPLDAVPTDLVITNGVSKLVFVINAGSDLAGEITVTGTSVDRNTGAESGADTDTITVDATTTDASSTDANGNIVHDFTGAYITSKWFTGVVTLSTVDLTLTDVDVWQCAFEQFGDTAVTVTGCDVTIECNDTAGWADIYVYRLLVTGDKCDIDTFIDMHVTTAESTADRYYRKRRGLLTQAIDGSTDGVWMDVILGRLPQQDWEDINTKLWYDTIYPVDIN